MPGGGALGVGVTMTMQRSWGIPVSETALAMVVSGVWNNFVKLGLPVVALALLALERRAPARRSSSPSLIGLAVLAVAIGLFALLLRSEHMAAQRRRRASAGWPRPSAGWSTAARSRAGTSGRCGSAPTSSGCSSGGGSGSR